MGKPDYSVYSRFREKYFALCDAVGKEQYLVPYLMSSHPGSTLHDAVELALCLKREGYAPEQVQDFYPTPGTASTVMYYTGINPLTGKDVYVATDYHEKQLQRALLQYNRPQSAELVREALMLCGREDLIGHGKHCLVKPAGGGSEKKYAPSPRGKGGRENRPSSRTAGGKRNSSASAQPKDGRSAKNSRNSRGKKR